MLGIFGVMAAFGLFYLGERVFHLDRAHIQTLMYLKLSVAGHLTIFLTRTRGPFWSIRPARILWMAVLGTQAVATLIAVYGLFMTPLGWGWAGFVWGYALVWALVNDRVKLAAYWVVDRVDKKGATKRTAEPKLFNAMDASPFRERDLDPDAEEFIVGWAREASRDAKLALLVNLDRDPGPADEPAALRDAIGEFFSHRAQASRSRLRQLLRVGRTSLLVGLVFLAVTVGAGDLIARAMRGPRLGELLREGLAIGGWVAMWRPLEIFLYGWWPIRTETRLYERLSVMPVRIAYRGKADPEAWRHDWPAVGPVQTTPQKAPSPERSGGRVQRTATSRSEGESS